ncbi:MAG: DUF3662 and FHA domain-containing protein [Actinomycetes bacterium]
MGLKRFEERLERLVEGSLTRPFRSNLQPVEIGRRLTREMDLQRRVSLRGRLVAPNAFSVSLSSADVDRFSTHVDALVRELAEAAREHAEAEGYSLLGPVEVDIFESTKLRAGHVGVTARVQEGDHEAVIAMADGRRIPVGTTAIVIGRLPDCAIVLNDSNVSRRHAEIIRQGEDIVLNDLGSTNGTKVNGMAIRSVVLQDGDEIYIGISRLMLETR